MNFEKDIKALSDEELMKVSGGMNALPELSDNPFIPDNSDIRKKVSDSGVSGQVRLTTDDGSRPWLKLSPDNSELSEPKEAGKYELQYHVVSKSSDITGNTE